MVYEPSIWDLQKQIEQLRADIKEGFVNVRSDAREDVIELRNTINGLRFIDPALFEERTSNIKKDIDRLNTKQNKTEDRLRQYGILIISAFFAPYVVGVAIVLTLRMIL